MRVWRSILSHSRSLITARDGGILIIMAIALPVLILATGVAVDFSRYTKSKANLRNSVDQATLAAASTISDQPEKYALDYLNSNLRDKGDAITIKDFTLTHNDSKTVWEGAANGSVKLAFAGVFGAPDIKMQHRAKVSWDDTRKSEVVAMVDTSGTMCGNFERWRTEQGTLTVGLVQDWSCKKLTMMQTALREIAEIGVGFARNKEGEPLYRVGLVPYTYKVRLPNPASLPSFMTSQEWGDPEYYTRFEDAEPVINRQPTGPIASVSPLMGIGSAEDKEALLQRISKIFGSGDVLNRPFMKRSALGGQISALMLDPRYHNVFNGMKPADFNDNGTKKVVIMMTDTANLGCCFTNWPPGYFPNHYVYSYNPDNAQLMGKNLGTAHEEKGVCKLMKEAGVEIFTVLLDVNRTDMDARGEEIIDAFRDCASSEQHAFEVAPNDEEALKTAYQTIGRAVARLRLTE